MSAIVVVMGNHKCIERNLTEQIKEIKHIPRYTVIRLHFAAVSVKRLVRMHAYKESVNLQNSSLLKIYF